MRAFAAVIAAVVLAGCSDPAPVTTDLGGLEVSVFPEPARLRIRSGDRVLLDGRLFSRRAEATYEFQFGAFKIEETAEPWAQVTRLSNIVTAETSITFDMHGAGGALAGTGTITAAGAGGVAIELDFDDAHNRASIAFGCAAREHFLGMGGQSYDVDHRGQTVPVWVQEQGVGKVPWDDYDNTWFLTGRRHSAYAALPMYVSSRGYGLALETGHRSVFSFCSEVEDEVRVQAWEPRLALRVFDGPGPGEVIERMTGWVGRPELPPAFAFGPWIDAIFGSDNVRRVVQKLRDEDIAASAIWTEDWRGAIDSAQGYRLSENWELDRSLYPDFEALSSDVRAAGFKFLTYNNSFVEDGTPVFDEAVAGGYTIMNSSGDPYLFVGKTFTNTSLVDLTNPDAVSWTKQKYREGLQLGADGYMADFGEWLPTDAVLASGADARAAHNLYPVAWQRLNKDVVDELYETDGIDRLFFVRSAYLGSQPLVSVIWAGDQETEFDADDGIPTIVPIGIGLGITGFPYFGHDIAGYLSIYTPVTSRELWFRWVTLGALSPVMRTHHGTHARDNWSWESDAGSTAHLRRWARFHTQLFPYLYALARQASDTGLPMFRPLALSYPSYEEAWTLTDQFMLGDRLIVAPVVTQGATARDVWLPEGAFYRVGSPGRIDSPAGGSLIANVAAPLEEIPLFVPAGTLLVLLPDTIDTLVDATAPDLVRLADVGDDRELWLWPGGASEWTEVGGLRYQWTAAELTTPPASATFNDQPITLISGGGWVRADVTGSGTLRFGDGATLTIEGGAATRRLTVRLYR